MMKIEAMTGGSTTTRCPWYLSFKLTGGKSGCLFAQNGLPYREAVKLAAKADSLDLKVASPRNSILKIATHLYQ